MSIVRVVVIDDSAYVRKVFKQMLLRSPFIDVVGTARDGAEGLEMVQELNPDVVTCDLNMPTMDGVEFVRQQMARQPMPIIISSIASKSGEQVLSALDAGAIDFVHKPTALATDKLLSIGDELVEKVKAAAQSPLKKRVATATVDVQPGPARWSRTNTASVELVVIGASTGGPQALKRLVPRLPRTCPVPVVIVLHMPVGYTDMYARKLDEVSELEVSEARGGEPLTGGRVYVAPAGRHLTFRREGASVLTQLDLRPLDALHRPSVDVMFQSAAEVFGGAVIGVVLTGMGSDGREGAAWIKAKGGRILTESEESCVVYGMPRAVAEAGLSDVATAIDLMAQAIMDRL